MSIQPAANTGVIERPTSKVPSRGKPSAAKSWLKAIELTSRIEANPRALFADLVDDWAKRQPDRAALISEAETFSYRALSERINQYARWALASGIKTGDAVCLLMPNRPDYIAAWLGIGKVGGVVALINTKLVGQSLAHCINLAKADHVILARELADNSRPRVHIWIARRKSGFAAARPAKRPWTLYCTRSTEGRCRRPSGARSLSATARC
jgi:fatty-acyl-CoA synthase